MTLAREVCSNVEWPGDTVTAVSLADSARAMRQPPALRALRAVLVTDGLKSVGPGENWHDVTFTVRALELGNRRARLDGVQGVGSVQFVHAILSPPQPRIPICYWPGDPVTIRLSSAVTVRAGAR
jgi:hypothetical protein